MHPSTVNALPASPRSDHRRASARRPWLWCGGTLAMLAAAAWALGADPGVSDARQLIRLTAWTSLLCFVLAHMASTWWRRWPSALSSAVLAHRRQLGLLMLSSHLLHAAGIAALGAWAEPALWGQLTPVASRVIGGAGYAALLVMACTSWGGAVARLGRARWRRLHTVAGWLIWWVYLLAMLKRAGLSPVYALTAALLLALGLLKVWTARTHRP